MNLPPPDPVTLIQAFIAGVLLMYRGHQVRIQRFPLRPPPFETFLMAFGGVLIMLPIFLAILYVATAL